MNATFHGLQYLKSTPLQGLIFPMNGGNDLIAYCDESWLIYPTSRRSCTHYFISLGGASLLWRKKGSVVSRSSVESEYRAIGSTVCEVLWLIWFLENLDANLKSATQIMCDSDVKRHIATNPVYHERTKHVQMDYHFACEHVNKEDVKPCAIRNEHQRTYIFTKALGA